MGITLMLIIQARTIIVYAKTDPERGKAKGITAFIIEGGMAGLHKGEKVDKLQLGMRGRYTCLQEFAWGHRPRIVRNLSGTSHW